MDPLEFKSGLLLVKLNDGWSDRTCFRPCMVGQSAFKWKRQDGESIRVRQKHAS